MLRTDVTPLTPPSLRPPTPAPPAPEQSSTPDRCVYFSCRMNGLLESWFSDGGPLWMMGTNPQGAEGVGGLRSPSLQLHWWWGLWQPMVHPSTSSSLPPAWSEEGWWLVTLLPCSGCRNRGPQMGWFKQQKFIVSQFCGLELVLRGLSPQLVGGHLLTVSSFALPSVGLSPHLLFL